jgi:hypothetical protein
MFLVKKNALIASLLAAGILAAPAAHSAIWSDTYIGYRYGTAFDEPFNGKDIKKNIFNLQHVSGFKYGTNFLNVDMLLSDDKDPARVNSGTSKGGAQEIYVVYRNTLDLGKIFDMKVSSGPVRGFGFTSGFDTNVKNDAGYGSKKRMLVAGPTLFIDVPGFLNVSVLGLLESNQPYGVNSRYTYRKHAMLTAAWGIPIAALPAGASFEGFMNIIEAKGKNEFGGPTATETNFDAQLMFDVGALAGAPAKTFKAGIEYQYWKNKFGNPSSVPGSKASTPMIRAQYHF